MSYLLLLQSHSLLYAIAAILLGLIIGSFLNVIITRYPKMLHRSWEKQCLEFLHQPATADSNMATLSYPRSHCPQCHTPLKIWHNIPLLSYLLLRGKCHFCRQSIAALYPIIEATTALVTLLVVYRFGLDWQTPAALILSWALIVLSGIDAKEKILPDNITLTLMWLGLIISPWHIFVSPTLAIAGASVGYLILWAVAKLYAAIRHREGMGHGDFKMLALLGAWLGIGALLNIIILATTLGLIVALSLLISKRTTRHQPLAFGPFLAIAGWLTLMLGPFIVNNLIQLGS